MTQQTSNKNGTNLPEKKKQKTVADSVLNRVGEMANSGEIRLPKNYSAENAIKSAYLILTDTVDRNKKPVLETCTQPSIINALLKMVIQGLSPDRSQCAFVPYGNKLTLVREYQGTIALAKRYAGLKMAYANVIYEGDDFAYKVDPETGLKTITKHEQVFDNIDTNKIRGAYAVLHFRDDSKYVEVMTITQIKQSWQQGDAKGNSPAHTKFPDEMAKKTVISRACKPFVNSSLDVDDEADKGETYLDPNMEVISSGYDEDTETLSLTEPEQRQEQPEAKEPEAEQQESGQQDEQADGQPEKMSRDQHDQIMDLANELKGNDRKVIIDQLKSTNSHDQAEKLIRQLQKKVGAGQKQPETADQPGF